jgi:hypothetical protein
MGPHRKIRLHAGVHAYVITDSPPPPSPKVGVLGDDTDPMVTVMKVDKAPTETYADIGGLESQIQEIKEAVELPLSHPEVHPHHARLPSCSAPLCVLASVCAQHVGGLNARRNARTLRPSPRDAASALALLLRRGAARARVSRSCTRKSESGRPRV